VWTIKKSKYFITESTHSGTEGVLDDLQRVMPVEGRKELTIKEGRPKGVER
jgi:hypothetical protein